MGWALSEIAEKYSLGSLRDYYLLHKGPSDDENIDTLHEAQVVESYFIKVAPSYTAVLVQDLRLYAVTNYASLSQAIKQANSELISLWKEMPNTHSNMYLAPQEVRSEPDYYSKISYTLEAVPSGYVILNKETPRPRSSRNDSVELSRLSSSAYDYYDYIEVTNELLPTDVKKEIDIIDTILSYATSPVTWNSTTADAIFSKLARIKSVLIRLDGLFTRVSA
ncbi:hypothetical protein K1X76_04455 [bacterium]|nr:hypothetical protein [bacterium]